MSLTPEQLELRRKAVFASELGMLIPGCPWYNPRKLYWSKVDPTKLPDYDSEWMQDGNDIEEAILRWYERTQKVEIHRGTVSYLHQQHPTVLLGATPDGLSPDGKIGYECKNVIGAKICEWTNYDGEITQETIPLHYLCQVQCQIEVMGFEYAMLLVFFSTNHGVKKYAVRIDRDEAVIQQLKELANTFMTEYVMAGLEPVGTDSEFDGELMNKMYPHSRQVQLQADYADNELIANWYAASRLVAIFDGVQDALKVRIKERMQDSERLFSDYGPIDWKERACAVSGKAVLDYLVEVGTLTVADANAIKATLTKKVRSLHPYWKKGLQYEPLELIANAGKLLELCPAKKDEETNE